MHYQTSFSRFGGGGNGPNLAKQLLVIFGAWAVAKIWLIRPKGGDAPPQGISNKYRKPSPLYH